MPMTLGSSAPAAYETILASGLSPNSFALAAFMMTTAAALMATLPIALGLGAGAESRRPLGVAVVGGLAFSQLITLYITPVVYTYMDEFQRWLAGRRVRAPQALPGTPQPALSGD